MYLVAYVCVYMVMSLKYLESKRQADWIRGGDRKGMVLCSSRMAALRGEDYSISQFSHWAKKFL